MLSSLTRKIALLSAAALCAALPARADLSISTEATSNVSCSNGLCIATAKNAVLNVDDLTALLAAGAVEVATGAARDIRVDTAFGWSNASLLTLDAARSVTVNHTMKVQGSGGLAVITNDGGINGLFSFGTKGRIMLANPKSKLVINQQSYTLEAKISTLAADIAKNPGGSFALANNYDATGDGTYSALPLPPPSQARSRALETPSPISPSTTATPRNSGCLRTSVVVERSPIFALRTPPWRASRRKSPRRPARWQD